MLQASAIERIIQGTQGVLSPELSAYLLQLDFPAEDRARYENLSDKAQQGTLSEDEKAVLDDLLTANDVLTILQSKARSSMKLRNPAA